MVYILMVETLFLEFLFMPFYYDIVSIMMIYLCLVLILTDRYNILARLKIYFITY